MVYKGEFQMRLPNLFFSGFAGAGKSYCCQYVVEKYNAKISKFAYPVYGIARDWFQMTGKDRALLQLIGTECGRNLISKNLWINRFVEDLEIVEAVSLIRDNCKPLFVSDDCRFINEVELLKDLGWVGIWVNASDEVRKQRLQKRDGTAQEETLSHVSETEMNNFKDSLIQLDSNGTLEQTYANLDVILKELRTTANA